MMDWTPCANLTDEELILEYRKSDDPVIHELVGHLEEATDRAETAEQELLPERERIKELRDENQKFIAEIERLNSAIATPKKKGKDHV